ncbi:hypothetical protein JCM10207_006159 [Rhodosporidiobolus poonsookiae]
MSEPNPLSDADKIRLKRLARLQQQQNTTTTDPTPSTSTSTAPAPQPAAAPKPPQPAQQPAPHPAPPAQQPAAKQQRTAAPASTPTPAPRPAQTPAPRPVQQQQQARFAESFEQWEHETVGRILAVTLNVETAQRSNWAIVYLKDVAAELVEEEPSLPRPLRLSLTHADRLLLSRLSLPSTASEDPETLTVVAALPAQQTAFEFLAGAWKRERVERAKVVQKIAAGADKDEGRRRSEGLDGVKALVVSYLGLVLMDSGMFEQDHVGNKPLGPTELTPLFLPSVPTPPSLPLSPSSDAAPLLSDLAGRFIPSPANDHESGLEQILGPLLTSWNASLLLHKVDIGQTAADAPAGALPWREVLDALQVVLDVKGIAGWIATGEGISEAFDPTRKEGGVRPEQVEYQALLGAVTRLGTFPDVAPNLPRAYFPSPSTMGRGNIDSASASLRSTLNSVQSALFRLHSSILRAGADARAALLAYLSRVASLNAKRAAMRVEPGTVGSEAFVVNLHAVLLRLSEPFMDPGFSKIDKIDPTYYRHPEALVDVKEETKVNATKEESDAWFKEGAASAPPPSPHFIAHTFHLTLQYLHLGPLRAIREHKGLGQQVSHMERTLGDMEEEVNRAREAGGQGVQQAEGAVERYKAKLDLYRAHRLAYEVQLLDPDYLARCVAFANLTMAWLVRLADPEGRHPGRKVGLPLPDKTPDALRFLPEFIFEDITEILSFASKHAPQVLEQSPQDELMTFMLVFLSTPYMKNPYLKGQFVEVVCGEWVQIMYYLSRPTYTSPRGCLGDVINFHPLALSNLMPCLVHAYIEIEITGSHTQFYDKFNIRYYITQLFKLVWSNPTHRESLKRESQENFDRYVRFVNLLMNDTTYLLDDALINLGKIVDIQRLQDDAAAWAALSPAEQQDKEKLLKQHESSARADLDLGHESLRLLGRFSAETKAPFLTPEIVDRLAAMLDMNLHTLAGPRCVDLKVKQPDKYRFKPEALLKDVISIFENLGPHEQFQAAVAKDGRSYSAELFARVARIARRTAIKTDQELSVLEGMVSKVEAIRAQEEEDEAAGDVPDEFLDPLTYDLMRDPVLLPSSKTILDRSTIKQHYLSDATDPFNRQPLKWEDIVEATELKGQIEQFLEERRRKRTERLVAAQAAAEGAQEGEDKMKVDE